MGQNVCKCVKAESVDDNYRDVCKLSDNPPSQSTADATDSPPPAGATDGDVGRNRDGEKKRRFWRKLCTKVRRLGQPPPAADVHENRIEKRKKRRRFWKKTAPSEREEESDRRTEGKSYQPVIMRVSYSLLTLIIC